LCLLCSSSVPEKHSGLRCYRELSSDQTCPLTRGQETDHNTTSCPGRLLRLLAKQLVSFEWFLSHLPHFLAESATSFEESFARNSRSVITAKW
uniref:Uncharacterized protein n=1 Tax=Apteryx owenii TaxID=8824 RepID=A0A8B9S505_APTOW